MTDEEQRNVARDVLEREFKLGAYAEEKPARKILVLRGRKKK